MLPLSLFMPILSTKAPLALKLVQSPACWERSDHLGFSFSIIFCNPSAWWKLLEIPQKINKRLRRPI